MCLLQVLIDLVRVIWVNAVLSCSNMRTSVLPVDQFSFLSPDLRNQKDCRR